MCRFFFASVKWQICVTHQHFLMIIWSVLHVPHVCRCGSMTGFMQDPSSSSLCSASRPTALWLYTNSPCWSTTVRHTFSWTHSHACIRTQKHERLIQANTHSLTLTPSHTQMHTRAYRPPHLHTVNLVVAAAVYHSSFFWLCCHLVVPVTTDLLSLVPQIFHLFDWWKSFNSPSKYWKLLTVFSL